MVEFSLVSIGVLIIILITQRKVECSREAIFQRIEQTYLPNHVTGTKHARGELECAMFCSVHGSCTSVNYKTSGIGKGLCELNDENIQEISKAENKTRDLAEFTHYKIIKKVIKCHIFCTFVK